jgi:hypothetical protein
MAASSAVFGPAVYHAAFVVRSVLTSWNRNDVPPYAAFRTEI